MTSIETREGRGNHQENDSRNRASAQPVPEKAMPHDIGAEQAVLGSVILNPVALSKEGVTLEAADFYREAHVTIWRAVLALKAAQKPVDYITLGDYLEEHGELEAIGGHGAIDALISSVPNSSHIQHYAGIVKRKSALRKQIMLASKIAGAAYDGNDVALSHLRAEVAALGQEATLKVSRFRLVSVAELQERPPMAWLVGGLLPEVGLSMISAPEANLKSFFALHVAGCIATGRAVHPAHPVHKQGPVIYIAGEGATGMRARIAAWELEHKQSLDGKLFLVEESPQLLTQADIDEAIREIQAIGTPPVLIINDTLACSIAGADENATKDMTLAGQALQRLKRTFGCNVLTVHHDGYNGKARGSSAMMYGLDTRMAAKLDGATLTITCIKQKDAEGFTSIAYTTKRLLLDDYGHSSSLVLCSTKAAPEQTSPLDEKQMQALCALPLDGIMRHGKWLEASGLPKGTFNNHVLPALKSGGYVINEADGYKLTEQGRKLVPLVPNQSRGTNGTEQEVSPVGPRPFRDGTTGLTSGPVGVIALRQDLVPAHPSGRDAVNSQLPIDKPTNDGTSALAPDWLASSHSLAGVASLHASASGILSTTGTATAVLIEHTRTVPVCMPVCVEEPAPDEPISLPEWKVRRQIAQEVLATCGVDDDVLDRETEPSTPIVVAPVGPPKDPTQAAIKRILDWAQAHHYPPMETPYGTYGDRRDWVIYAGMLGRNEALRLEAWLKEQP